MRMVRHTPIPKVTQRSSPANMSTGTSRAASGTTSLRKIRGPLFRPSSTSPGGPADIRRWRRSKKARLTAGLFYSDAYFATALETETEAERADADGNARAVVRPV